MKELDKELGNFKTKIETANQLIDELSKAKERIDSAYKVIIEVREFFESQNRKIETVLINSNEKVENGFSEQLESILRIHESNSKIMNDLQGLATYLNQKDTEFAKKIDFVTEEQKKNRDDLSIFLHQKFSESLSAKKEIESNALSQMSNVSAHISSQIQEVEIRVLNEISKQKEDFQNIFQTSVSNQNSMISGFAQELMNVIKVFALETEKQLGEFDTNFSESNSVLNRTLETSSLEILNVLRTYSNTIFNKTDKLTELFLQETKKMNSDFLGNANELKNESNERFKALDNRIIDLKKTTHEKLVSMASDNFEMYTNTSNLIESTNKAVLENEIRVEAYVEKQVKTFKWISISTLLIVIAQFVYIMFNMN